MERFIFPPYTKKHGGTGPARLRSHQVPDAKIKGWSLRDCTAKLTKQNYPHIPRYDYTPNHVKKQYLSLLFLAFIMHFVSLHNPCACKMVILSNNGVSLPHQKTPFFSNHHPP